MRKLTQITILSLMAVLLATSVLAPSAEAIPVLQMYVDGAMFDTDTETWIVSSPTFNLWVVGNTSQFGPILDVKLAAAYATGEVGSISLAPTTTSLLPDPSTPLAPILNPSVGADGTIPVKSDGTSLGAHGIYGTGTSFHQFELGDMTLTDSPIGDFGGTFPGIFPRNGQINVYTVTVSGYSAVHFDAFNHVEGHNSAFFSPNSHDAALVPESSTYLLMGLGLAGILLAGGLRRTLGGIG